jgi:hypothetical protein
MNRRLLPAFVLLALFIVVAALFVSSALMAFVQKQPTPTGEFDFTVSSSSDCLRFLNSSVPAVYVPFTVAANQNYQLTINCTKMPGGVNGWTDVYIYKSYWDDGANHTCRAMDLYPILDKIEATDLQVKVNQSYIGNFGESTPQSYTVFFIVPPGGPSTFHVTYKPA